MLPPKHHLHVGHVPSGVRLTHSTHALHGWCHWTHDRHEADRKRLSLCGACSDMDGGLSGATHILATQAPAALTLTLVCKLE